MKRSNISWVKCFYSCELNKAFSVEIQTKKHKFIYSDVQM